MQLMGGIKGRGLATGVDSMTAGRSRSLVGPGLRVASSLLVAPATAVAGPGIASEIDVAAQASTAVARVGDCAVVLSPAASASPEDLAIARAAARRLQRPRCPVFTPATGPAEPGGPAVITISRAMDLDGQAPVRWARSGSAAGGMTVALASGGQAIDPVRLLNPPPAMAISATGGFRPHALPLDRAVRTSGFGLRIHPLLGGARMHSGLDLAAPFGTPIRAASDGVVGGAGRRGGYGLTVRLQHGGGMETRYAHMSRIAVAPGQAVHAGDVIGYVGSTGLSTGPHLHYEVRKDGRAVDPSAVPAR